MEILRLTPNKRSFNDRNLKLMYAGVLGSPDRVQGNLNGRVLGI
jgi:hypothetical protein